MEVDDIRKRMVADCYPFDPKTDDKYDLYRKGVKLGEEALLDVIEFYLRRRAKSFGHAELTSNGKVVYVF